MLSLTLLLSMLALAPIIALTVRSCVTPTYRLRIRDGVLSPATLKVPAHAPFRLAITNEDDNPATVHCPLLKKPLAVAPGASRQTLLHALAPGAYAFAPHSMAQTPSMSLQSHIIAG